MSQAIDDLKHEHQAIEAALKTLGQMEQRLLAGEVVDPADLAAFLAFLKEFADECHHGKEEGFLFPALMAAANADPAGPVGVMLREHAQGRKWIAQMQASLSPTLNATAFARAARAYAELLEPHIQKENEVLFPMAERVLSTQQLDGLAAAFEAHEQTVIGAGRHEALHAILKSLKEKYPASA